MKDSNLPWEIPAGSWVEVSPWVCPLLLPFPYTWPVSETGDGATQPDPAQLIINPWA